MAPLVDYHAGTYSRDLDKASSKWAEKWLKEGGRKRVLFLDELAVCDRDADGSRARLIHCRDSGVPTGGIDVG